jgi:hypothetical protein
MHLWISYTIIFVSICVDRFVDLYIFFICSLFRLGQLFVLKEYDIKGCNFIFLNQLNPNNHLKVTIILNLG